MFEEAREVLNGLKATDKMHFIFVLLAVETGSECANSDCCERLKERSFISV